MAEHELLQYPQRGERGRAEIKCVVEEGKNTRSTCLCRGTDGDIPRTTPGDDCREGGGASSFVACLGRLTIDHASLSRRGTDPTPNRDTFDVGRSLRFVSILYIETFC